MAVRAVYGAPEVDVEGATDPYVDPIWELKGIAVYGAPAGAYTGTDSTPFNSYVFLYRDRNRRLLDPWDSPWATE